MAVFVILYLQRLSSELFNLGEILFGYDKIMLQVAPMTEILMEPAKILDMNNRKINIKRGNIKFLDVTYTYSDNPDNPVLEHFNLEIPAGQKVGLVGYSGAGKTTLTKLLLRFDDLNAGQIEIDNQDISKFTQKSLRQSISYVPQEPMLFHRTLRENIAYGKSNATDAQIIKAAKLANAYDFIKKLPNGLDTIVGERGVKLSGGQRQRIVIARSILKNAPILILDEATSALDSESESLIQKSLGVLMKGRTSIVVAHRLSTISKLDRIIVIDKGKIIEDGSHSELLLKNGEYAKLWRHQSGGFIEESV
jgi:ATP-binding cassette subfamily B protein